MLGTIFDIKPFAIHDGPGIRTTVFFKGCPLRCAWCHNPEGIQPGRDIWVKRALCLGCGTCIESCGENAIDITEGKVRIRRDICTFCDICLQQCPTGALRRIDRTVEAKTLANEIARDQLFFELSGGGATLSGGEPTAQGPFMLELLRELKARGIHCCVETSMHADREVLEKALPLVDLFLVDIKLLDDAAHVRYTGVSNQWILSNFRYLATAAQNIRVRVPLIPGITDGADNLRAIHRFVKDVRKDLTVELLNYNRLTPSKYDLLDIPYFNRDLSPLSEGELRSLNALVR